MKTETIKRSNNETINVIKNAPWAILEKEGKFYIICGRYLATKKVYNTLEEAKQRINNYDTEMSTVLIQSLMEMKYENKKTKL